MTTHGLNLRNKSRLIKPITIGIPAIEAARISQRSLSSGGRRLLASGNSDQVTIERNGPVDRGRHISRDQPIGVLPSARDAVVAPDVIRFAIEKVDRLHVTRMKDRYEEIADCVDVL